MRHHSALIFCAAAFLCIPALLADNIHGQVTDPSGAVVPNATVRITARDNNQLQSTRTDLNGSYSFENLASGNYLLEVRASGFGSPEPRAIASDSGEPVNVQLTLPRVASEVEVTGTATALTTDEQAKAVDIVDAQELDHREVFSVAEAIRFLPGMHVEQEGGPGSLVKITSRGMPVYDTAVLIDGFRFRDAAAPQGDVQAFLGDLMVTDADRVEVLRGTGSSLYGTGASAGVINVVTDNGGGRTRGEIQAEGGGLGLFRGVARIAGSAMHDRIGYSGGISHLDATNGFDGSGRYRNSSAQGFLRFDLTPSTMITARLFGANTWTQLNADPSAAATIPAGEVPAIANVTFIPDANDPDYSRGANYVAGVLGVTHKFTENATVRVMYQGAYTDRDTRNGPVGPGFFQPQFNTSSVDDGRLDTLQARADFQAGRFNLITAGYEVEREHYHDHSVDQNPDLTQRLNEGTDIEQRSNAVFAQDQLRLLQGRLLVSLSGRLQAFSLDRPTFVGGDPLYTNPKFGTPPNAYTGDASVAYLIGATGTKLRAHGGNAYRAPSLYERFGSSYYLGSFTAYGDPLLKPERLVALDAGFDQYIANQRARISGTYFYTQIQQAIFFDFSGAISAATDPYGRYGGYLNTGGGLARGVELETEWAVTRSTNVHANYTYTNSRERHSILSTGSLRALRVPDHTFSFQAMQRIGRRVDATFDFLATSNYLFPFYVYPEGSRPFIFPGSRRGDVALNYTIPLTDRTSVRLYGRVENAFNQKYYEEGFRTPGIWAVGGMKFVF